MMNAFFPEIGGKFGTDLKKVVSDFSNDFES